MLGSVGVLLAGVIMLVTGWAYADPLVAIAIGLFVVPRAFGLGRQAVRILVQAAPAHVDVPLVRPSWPPCRACTTSTTCTCGR